MIEVTIPESAQNCEREIMSWCGTHIGRMATHPSHVGELYPWRPSVRFAHTVYQFARERDAFLFKLRWL